MLNRISGTGNKKENDGNCDSSHWPEPLDNDIRQALLFYLDLDRGLLVLDLVDTELLCIDKPLQGNHVSSVHPLEIVPIIRDFYHCTPPNLI